MTIQIIFENRAGASCMMRAPSPEVQSLYATLCALRKKGCKFAEAWTVDEYDVRINVVGGIDEIEGADDKRIKYQVWAERHPLEDR
ncbi:MAG TPA: hypothetical protein VKD24_01470 [Candidatus Angelobacter sp.]|nr:hypothetical protein [Candidatus Angelobacter sp.]